MAKKEKVQENVDTTGWMVTFGDLIMLLLTFFVMLLTMKSLETAAIQAMFNAGGLGGGVGALLFPENDKKVAILVSSGKQDKMLVVSYKMLQKLLDEGESADLDDTFGDKYGDVVNIYENKLGYVVSISSSVLFESGQADIKLPMYPILDRISKVLNAVANDVMILGHTDNLTPDTGTYSNWELSLSRALSVHSYFINEKKLEPNRFSTGGCGDSKPDHDSGTMEGRMRNRRVEIILERKQ